MRMVVTVVIGSHLLVIQRKYLTPESTFRQLEGVLELSDKILAAAKPRSCGKALMTSM